MSEAEVAQPVTKLAAMTISLRKVKDPGKLAWPPNPTLAEAILRAEEYSDQQTMWSHANEILKLWADTCNPDEIAAFAIFYEDGRKYDGSLDLKDRETLEYHIKDFCLAWTEQHRPSHMTEYAYRRFLRHIDKEAQNDVILFLENYQIGVEE